MTFDPIMGHCGPICGILIIDLDMGHYDPMWATLTFDLDMGMRAERYVDTTVRGHTGFSLLGTTECGRSKKWAKRHVLK